MRLLVQGLHRLGYSGVARELEAASSIAMQPPSATEFREAVLAGRWDAALALLPQLAASGTDLKHAQFLVLRQKYVECVAAGDAAAALCCLRSELQPLQVNQKVLHRLAGEAPLACELARWAACCACAASPLCRAAVRLCSPASRRVAPPPPFYRPPAPIGAHQPPSAAAAAAAPRQRHRRKRRRQ